MKFLTYMAAVGAIAGLSLLAGCETTRNDVTAARNKVEREQQKLEEVKREEARKVDKEVSEAETARTTNKPIVGDDINEGPREEAREAERKAAAAQERIRNQAERVQDAKVEAAKTEEKLTMEQSRDKFLIDCKAAMDLANRAIEKLETKRNAADDDGKKAIDDQIATIKAKRDDLQKEINSIRAADVMRWTDHKAVAQKAMDELLKEVKNVS